MSSSPIGLAKSRLIITIYSSWSRDNFFKDSQKHLGLVLNSCDDNLTEKFKTFFFQTTECSTGFTLIRINFLHYPPPSTHTHISVQEIRIQTSPCTEIGQKPLTSREGKTRVHPRRKKDHHLHVVCGLISTTQTLMSQKRRQMSLTLFLLSFKCERACLCAGWCIVYSSCFNLHIYVSTHLTYI